MLVVEASLTLTLLQQYHYVSGPDSSVLLSIPFLFLILACFIVENVLS